MNQNNHCLRIRKDKNKLAFFMHLGKLDEDLSARGSYIFHNQKVGFKNVFESSAAWEESMDQGGHAPLGIHFCLIESVPIGAEILGVILGSMALIAKEIGNVNFDVKKVMEHQDRIFSLFIEEHRVLLHEVIMTELLVRYCLEKKLPEYEISDPSTYVGQIMAIRPPSITEISERSNQAQNLDEACYDFSML